MVTNDRIWQHLKNNRNPNCDEDVTINVILTFVSGILIVHQAAFAIALFSPLTHIVLNTRYISVSVHRI